MAYWTNEKIIELIENYKIAECIWNHKHDQHNCRNSVNNAWMAISLSVGEDILEIKRKMKNLVGQFYREHRKFRKLNKSIPGPEIKPKWFAYNHLLFLQTRKKKKAEVNIDIDTDEGQNEDSLDSLWSDNENDTNCYEIPLEIKETKLEITGIENDNSEESAGHKDKEFLSDPITSSTSYKILPENRSTNPNNLQERRINRLRYPNGPKIFRKKKNENEKRKIALMKEVYNKSKNKNECDIFGELVACKMKNLQSDFARNNVEHIISNVLWEASLGKFDHPSNISSAESQSPGSSTSYPNDPLCSSSDNFGYSILNVEHQKNKTVTKSYTNEK